MSAFVPSRTHLNTLVAVAVYGPLGTRRDLWHAPGHPEIPVKVDDWSVIDAATNETPADRLLSILTRDVVASVRYRYPRCTDTDLPGCYPPESAPLGDWTLPARYDTQTRSVDPVQALKAIDCYEYQACETPAWVGSRTKEWCDDMRRALIHVLPGYNDAKWEIG